MDVSASIADLLTRHDCVILPGFGGFIGNPVPAHIDPLRHIFHPPSKKLLFNVHLRQNDGLLANAVAEAYGISYEEGSREVVLFTESCRKALNAGNPVVLPGLGQWLPGPDGIIFFEQDTETNLLADSFGLTPFISPPVPRHDERAVAALTMSVRSGAAHRPVVLRQTLRWAAAIALPVGLAAVIGLARYGAATSPAESQAGIFGSLFSRFSATSLEARKAAPVSHPARIIRAIPDAPKPVAENLPVVNTAPCPGKVSAGPMQYSDRFAVIVGAFRFKENAERLVAGLLGQGIQAVIYDQSKGGLYRVAFGRTSDHEEAMQLLASAKSMSFPGAWILAK